MSDQRTYDWIGQTHTIRRPDISDEEVARQVRMLSPSDLNHEMVCLLGRDRIMALTKELTAARQRIAELTDQCDNKETRLLAAARRIAELEAQSDGIVDNLTRALERNTELESQHKSAIDGLAEFNAKLLDDQRAKQDALQADNARLRELLREIREFCCDSDLVALRPIIKQIDEGLGE